MYNVYIEFEDCLQLEKRCIGGSNYSSISIDVLRAITSRKKVNLRSQCTGEIKTSVFSYSRQSIL